MAGSGGLLRLLDAYIAIGGDTSGFDAALGQSEAKAKAAGDRIESTFSPRRVLGALATASAAAFGVMTKGGLDLNETLTNVQARSGATGAQWDAMSNAIQRQNRRTTLSLTEIGDGVAAITTDLQASAGEVGMAADRLTDFGLVARESFASAVKGADDVHDAYQLTLAETLSVLDTLVAGQQKFGGVLTTNREALISIAPALIAANMSWQQGTELINLFNSAGVDASTMTMALQHALTKVKSPEEFQRLVADIQTTEDPFARATKAADLFGARAGAKMANALAPGRGAIEDYGFTTQETAGKVETAARKIDSSWRRTLDLLVQNVTGFLAQVGNMAGPLVSIAGSIGSSFAGLALMFPGLGTKLVDGLKGLLVRLLPAALAAGAATGTAMGGAAAAADIAAEVAAEVPAKVAKAILPEAIASGTTVGTAMGTSIGVAMGPALALAIPAAVLIGLQALKPEIQKQLDNMGLHVPNLFEGQGVLAPPAGLTPGTGANPRQAWIDAGLEAADGLASTKPALEAAATTAFSGIPAAIAGLTAATRQAIADHLAAAAGEIRNRRSGIDAAIDQLNADLKNKPLTQTTELDRLLKARTSKSLTDALKSPDAQIRADAKALATQLDSAIADLKPRSGIMSSVSKALIADLQKSTEPELKGFAGWFALQLQTQNAIAWAVATMPSVEAGRGGISANATPAQIAARQAAIAAGIKSAGSEVVVSKAISDLLKGALESADPLIKADAKAAGTRVTGSLADEINQAPFNLDPLRSRIAAAFALLTRGLGGGLSPLTVGWAAPVGTGTIGGYASGLPYVAHDMLAVIHQREAVLTVPQADDWRSGRPGTGGRGVSVNIEHVEIADAHDEFSLTQQLQFLASVG